MGTHLHTHTRTLSSILSILPTDPLFSLPLSLARCGSFALSPPFSFSLITYPSWGRTIKLLTHFLSTAAATICEQKSVVRSLFLRSFLHFSLPKPPTHPRFSPPHLSFKRTAEISRGLEEETRAAALSLFGSVLDCPPPPVPFVFSSGPVPNWWEFIDVVSLLCLFIITSTTTSTTTILMIPLFSLCGANSCVFCFGQPVL